MPSQYDCLLWECGQGEVFAPAVPHQLSCPESAFISCFPSEYVKVSFPSLLRLHNSPKLTVSSMPDGPDRPETWVFHLAMAWLGDPDHSLSYTERLAMIKERATGLGEPARSAFTWIPEETLVHKADISYWISQPWDNRGGRLTLVGDAAHPMPPCKCVSISPLSIESHLLINIPQTVARASITASATFLTFSMPSRASAPTTRP